MLRSNNQREVPPDAPCDFVSGTTHPTAEDLKDLLDESGTGSLRLPFATPLLATQPNRMNRIQLYSTDLVLNSDKRCMHVWVHGPTGVGKNTRAIDHLRLSAIMDPAQSVVVFSLKSTDYGSVSAMCSKYRKKLVVINLINAWRSKGWNPLETEDQGKAFDVISRFAQSIKNPLSSDSEFWTQWLVTALMGCYEEGIRSFPDILQFFSTERKELIENLRSHKNDGSRALANFLAGGSHNADTVLATLISSLSLFRSDDVQRVMSKDELKLESVLDSPVCIYVEMPETSLETLRPLYQMLSRMITDQAIENAERAGSSEQIPVTVFYDDLPSLGPVLNPSRLMTYRSRGIGIVAGGQSVSSLELVYGRSTHALLDNFYTKIVLPGGSALDSDFFSKATGEQLVAIRNPAGQDSVLVSRPLISAAGIRCPEHEHYLLGKPATIFYGPQTFQVYLQKTYELPDWAEFCRASKEVTGRDRLRKKRIQKLNANRDFGGKSNKSIDSDSTDTNGWTEEQYAEKIASMRSKLNYNGASPAAKAWWTTFEYENKTRPGLIVKLQEELASRDATVEEFFQAYRQSESETIMANIHFLHYLRLKG